MQEGMPDICKEEKIRAYSRKRNIWGRGGGRQNLTWGIGEVDAKNADWGMPEAGVKKNSRRGGVVEVIKNTGGLSDA